jgi:flagellar biosynthesis protein FlhG
MTALPITAGALSQDVAPATEAQPPVEMAKQARRNVIAVASGKGGVGKTWFSITLAHAMARAGQRALLFDGDLGLANVDVQLGMTPRRDLGSVIAGQATMAQAVGRYEEGGFDIIAGRSGSGNLASLPPSRLTGLRNELHQLGQGYDWVVLDLGAGIERAVRILVGQSRTCLVIATDEPTSITDAYAFIKVTALDHLADDIRIVINMAANARDGERTYGTLRKACREFLKIEPPLAGIIRRDDRVKDSIRRQTALLTRHPNTEAALDIEAIARHLIAAP